MLALKCVCFRFRELIIWSYKTDFKILKAFLKGKHMKCGIKFEDSDRLSLLKNIHEEVTLILILSE